MSANIWLVHLPSPMLLAVLIVGFSAAGDVAHAASGLSYEGSLEYGSGDYTLTEATTTVLQSNEIRWTSPHWRLSVTLPLIHQDSPFVTYAGGMPFPSGRHLAGGHDQGDDTGPGDDPGPGGGPGHGTGEGPHHPDVEVPDPDTLEFSETGVADPLIRADLYLRPAHGVTLAVFAALKPPLADAERGFGTGEWDAGAGIGLEKAVGATLFYGELGYWVLGDLPELEIEDPLTLTLGVGRSWPGGTYSTSASLWASGETFEGIDGPASLRLNLERRLAAGRAVTATVGAGLTESAPDYTVSLGWRLDL